MGINRLISNQIIIETMAREEIINELNKLKIGEYLFFDPKNLMDYQDARNSFLKSEKIFEICPNKIIRLKNLKLKT